MSKAIKRGNVLADEMKKANLDSFFQKYDITATLNTWVDEYGLIWLEITSNGPPSKFRLFPEGANQLASDLGRLIKRQEIIREERLQSTLREVIIND